MSRIAMLVTAAVLLVPSAALAQPTVAGAPPAGSSVIDFNALLARIEVTNQFSALGVTISGRACSQAASAGFTSTYLDNSLLGSTTTFCLASQQPLPGFPALTFTFGSPINYFGVNASVVYNGAVFPNVLEDILTFTSPNGSLGLLTTTFSGARSPRFVAIQDATPFSSVTLSTGLNGYFAIDNLTFSPAFTGVVPEPSTYALMGMGLLALGVVVRRKGGAR